jgi:hypothetical protein
MLGSDRELRREPAVQIELDMIAVDLTNDVVPAIGDIGFM